jgi:hypothetical protein
MAEKKFCPNLVNFLNPDCNLHLNCVLSPDQIDLFCGTENYLLCPIYRASTTPGYSSSKFFKFFSKNEGEISPESIEAIDYKTSPSKT